MKERRASVRVPERDRVSVRFVTTPDDPQLEGAKFFCTTNDVSKGGLSFSTHTHVPVGSVMEITLFLTDPEMRFRHCGRVKWSTDVQEGIILRYTHGVQFTETKRGQDAAWSHMLEQKAALAAA